MVDRYLFTVWEYKLKLNVYCIFIGVVGLFLAYFTLSVYCQPTVGKMLVLCQPTVGQQITDCSVCKEYFSIPYMKYLDMESMYGKVIINLSMADLIRRRVLCMPLPSSISLNTVLECDTDSLK